MTPDPALRAVLEEAARRLPFPIATACRRALTEDSSDAWREWEVLSRDLLQPVLQYLSHLLLSDVVAAGQRPAHLFHRIQAVLSRPLAGQYAGFLRETARHYRAAGLPTAIPDLVAFLLSSDVDGSLLQDGKPLLGLLVDYRNLRAHGRIESPRMLDAAVAHVRALTAQLLTGLAVLGRYPLSLEDGTPLMGADAAPRAEAPPLLVVRAGPLALRPLLVKLAKDDLVLLEEADLAGRRLTYRGSTSYRRLGKKELAAGPGAILFEELKSLVARVRALEAMLPAADWQVFSERAAVLTDRTLALYEEMRKYDADLFVARPGWLGREGLFARYLASDRSILAISGLQGAGKSALAAHLAREVRADGHAVLLLNGQRLSYTDVTWSGNPFPAELARLVHVERPLDRAGVQALLRSAPAGKHVIVMVDAINEVDGIESRWNRFRALEELLAWASEAAQPGLKIVVTFRPDAYEDYGALASADLPPDLSSFAFPGTNPRKTWVVDLEPFDAGQARELYEKLAERPQLGMAPALAWDDLVCQAGPSLATLTGNPLLFGIFLRSHHGQGRLATTERDALFLRYTASLTGSAELDRRTWPARLAGFLRNGNIAPKERFLADLLDRMAEDGALALLVERLDPAKSKRDRRLFDVVHGGSRVMADLMEGGLLTEERIEIGRGEKPVVSRRITFVAELLSVADDQVVTKIQRRERLRTAVFTQLFFLVGIPAFAAALLLVVRGALHAQALRRGLDPGLARWVAHDASFGLIAKAWPSCCGCPLWPWGMP